MGEALKKADPSLVTEVDEAILLGADQVREMSLPQPARPPQDSFLTEEQFQALREATKSPKECWDGSDMAGCPEEMKNIWGRPLIFFNICRNPRKDPTPKQWEALRKTWPILDGVPDDELMKNLVECRKEFCASSEICIRHLGGACASATSASSEERAFLRPCVSCAVRAVARVPPRPAGNNIEEEVAVWF